VSVHTGQLRQIDVASIRREHPIEEVVRDCGVELRPAGHGFVGCCPFHEDTTPSMSVAGVPDRFTCFGCGAHGDVIDFVRRLHGMTFIEAARSLTTGVAGAPKLLYGTPTPRPLPARHRDVFTVSAERGFEINASAWQHFSTPVSNGFAEHYLLHHRGIDVRPLRAPQTIAIVGHAGHGWTSLVDAMRERGVTGDELLAMDLAQATRGGHLIDTLRDRIIIPVTDPDRRIRGFIGRDTTGDPRAPKYRNPTRTPTFDKSQVLYRPTHHTLNPSGTVVVVEGVLDALALAATAAVAGRTADLAPVTASGVAVTPAQAAQVLAISRKAHLVIALDADPAGTEGTNRWLTELVVERHRIAYVTHLPGGHDPADWIRRHGTSGLRAFSNSATPRPVGGITPTLPGRELARIAVNGNGDPVSSACQHLVPLIEQISPTAAHQLVNQAEREMTRQGWNDNGAFTASLRRYPETHAAYAGSARPLDLPPQGPGRDHGMSVL